MKKNCETKIERPPEPIFTYERTFTGGPVFYWIIYLFFFFLFIEMFIEKENYKGMNAIHMKHREHEYKRNELQYTIFIGDNYKICNFDFFKGRTRAPRKW